MHHFSANQLDLNLWWYFLEFTATHFLEQPYFPAVHIEVTEAVWAL
jgi:hypothetical protein